MRSKTGCLRNEIRTPRPSDTPLKEGNSTKYLEDKIDLMIYELYNLNCEFVGNFSKHLEIVSNSYLVNNFKNNELK